MNGWLVAAVCALYPMSGAAAVVIDSFTEGSISIGYGNDILDLDVIAGPVADQRRVWGNGVSNWTATLADGSGDILYGVDLRGTPSLSQWLNLHYSKSSGYVDLLGYSGFTIGFSALTGQGMLAVIFNDRQGTLVPITADGVVEYPFEYVLDGRPIPEFPSRVQFRVFAGTSDFSVRINEIAVVPEPAPAMLLLASGAAFLTRRRTITTGSPGVIRSPVAHHPAYGSEWCTRSSFTSKIPQQIMAKVITSLILAIMIIGGIISWHGGDRAGRGRGVIREPRGRGGLLRLAAPLRRGQGRRPRLKVDRAA